MTMSLPDDFTRLLLAWSDGDETAKNRVFAVVYGELKQLAAGYLRRERSDHVLQTTALVHEAYIRLVDARRVEWKNRAHFFGIAAHVMRQILVDHARGRDAVKRGGDAVFVSIDEAPEISFGQELDVLALNDALESLARRSERQSRIVELRFFGGLTIEEVAEVLRISPRTAHGEWSVARAWLMSQLQRSV